MSFTKSILYPANPNTTRGEYTKLSASKTRIAYANGKSIIVRDISDPAIAFAYSEHVHPTTVARISPSGYYCASADASGSIRIWDLVAGNQDTKYEYRVLPGKINDFEWDGESKRIIVAGDGRDKFGHAFMVDTGSSTGEIAGHSKAINAVAIRHQRPFRAATASDDTTIVFHQGAPYKYDKTIKTHNKFVQDLRYSPSGDHFASVGADSKAFLYDGKTGDVLGELEGDVHKGNIMGCSWSHDSKQLATASFDCTVKLWDVETKKCLSTGTLGSGIEHQQVGIAYVGDSFASLSISGTLNLWDSRVSSVVKVFEGPQKSITSATSTGSSTFLAGTADGRILDYDTSGHKVSHLVGSPHTNLVSGVSAAGGKAVSVGFDDKIKEIDGSGFVPSVASTKSQPKSVAIDSKGTAFVAGISSIEVFNSSQQVFQTEPKFSPASVSVTDGLVAVGGDDMKVHLYSWDGKSLQDAGILEGNKATVTALAFSPDGSLLATGDSSGKIVLFNAKEKTTITSRWSYHTARVNSLSFTADGQHCASGSLDTHAYIWSVARPLKNIAVKSAGPGGVNAVVWLGANDATSGKLATAGADGCARLWDITFHAPK